MSENSPKIVIAAAGDQVKVRNDRGSVSPKSPTGSGTFRLPSPFLPRRHRTKSTSEAARSGPLCRGLIKSFCRQKGHGFITPDSSPDTTLFVHISDIDGEYVPLEGDHVTYQVCKIPPKFDSVQAVHATIVDFDPLKHETWDGRRVTPVGSPTAK